MKFLPNKQKYKKQQKGKAYNKISSVNTLKNLNFNTIILESVSFGKITNKQLESMYKCINKYIKKSGRLILRIFPHMPVTRKPVEVRMGKGKGSVSFWIAKIRSGALICELETNSTALGFKALKQAQYKIPIKTKIKKSYGFR